MRLPVVANTIAGGPNALLQQILQNKILAQNAAENPAIQQGIANQEEGAGQNALSLGRWSNINQQGLANQNLGQGQVDLALGALAPNMTLAQLNALKASIGLTNAQTNLAGQNANQINALTQQIPADSAAGRALTISHVYSTLNPNPEVGQGLNLFQNQGQNSIFGSLNQNINQSIRGNPLYSNETNFNPPPVGTVRPFTRNGISGEAIFNGKTWVVK